MALAFFVVLCVVALTHPVKLVEQDAYAYRASIVALSHGQLTLSNSQYHKLFSQLLAADGGHGPGIAQWDHLASGRWVSEKNPGYPFFAVPFQLMGILRVAPLFYGALGSVGLFAGARRWLGRWGGVWAVGLFCSSGAASVFAWRDTMPTFSEASLLAAGTGAILWALLAQDAGAGRRTGVGLLGFLSFEGAVFVRYTDIVVLACAVVAVVLARRFSALVPRQALFWWVGSAVVFGFFLLVFNRLVYGKALSTGYSPGEITFGLGALPGNLVHMPAHLSDAMPVFWLGLVGVAGIMGRHAWLRRPASRGPNCAVVAEANRDLTVGAALGATWAGIWGLYAMYYWTAQTSAGPDSTLQVVRFFVPSLAPIALLGAWVLARTPRWTSCVAVVAFLGLGIWSFTAITTSNFVTSGGLPPVGGGANRSPGAAPPPQARPLPGPPGGDGRGSPKGASAPRAKHPSGSPGPGAP